MHTLHPSPKHLKLLQSNIDSAGTIVSIDLLVGDTILILKCLCCLMLYIKHFLKGQVKGEWVEIHLNRCTLLIFHCTL